MTNSNRLTGLLIVALYFTYTKSAIKEFSALNSGNCQCIGDILTFSCTAVGGGGTRWGGTAFNCPSLLNEIILRHSLYDSPSGTSGHCNEGAITARSIDVSESADVSCYTSQLSVTIQNISSTVTIQCTHNSLSGPIPIGESAVTAVSAPYPPPSDVNVTLTPGNITFMWNPVAPICSSLLYNITFNNCGDCPDNITNETTITCSYQQRPSICIFSIQSVICGLSGNPRIWILKPPDVPVVDLIPHYNNRNQTLVKANIIITVATNVTLTDNTLNTTHYNISYLSSTSELISQLLIVDDSVCNDRICNYTIDLSLSFQDSCPSHTVGINISAINVFGEGPPSQHDINGCNRFVELIFDCPEAMISSCNFLNENDSSEKSCNILFHAQGDPCCYAVTATSAALSIIVED